MNKLLELKFGSHLYGTTTENSDLDIKGIYIPTAKEIILGTYKETIQVSRPKKEGEKNTKEDIDIEYFSLDRFVRDLAKGQTWAFDFLFAPEDMYIHSSPKAIEIMTYLRANLDKLLTRQLNSFVGYAKLQSSKYGIKGTRFDALKRIMLLLETLPERDRLLEHSDKIHALVNETKELISLEKTQLIDVVQLVGNCGDLQPYLQVCGKKIGFTSTVKLAKSCYGKILNEYGDRAKLAFENNSVDFKALSHCVRVNFEAIELITTGKITFPLVERELITKIKTKQIPFSEIIVMIEAGIANLTLVTKNSTLREESDKEWVDQLIFDIYRDVVINEGNY